ncbi:Outer membrane protein assembly factor BamA [Cyanobium usitatum str. Tous]|jgi:outer membrane protein insertion porin family|uniref:BamA/TamA family outer membrane protein n=1 Tax=Cyanobium usitatum TaxID=2304190 RepID=UPI002AD554F3|nr:BamA/TamA family outer membrane protein [Cyanobium usitatum]CAK6688411.1 Outer membrane protein assembly factor BamA [Cyanobium usitatum str. Tous]
MAGLLSLKAVWPLMGAALLSASPALAQPASQQVDKPSADPASQTPAQGAEPAAKAEPKVLIAEVAIEGLQDHPERERLELAAYAAMAATPGSRVTRNELQTDLSAIYASGWFSDVRIQPVDGPLGVRLVVVVVANPVLEQVKLDPADLKLPEQVVKDTFAADYGKTLNLNTLQTRMQELQRWYADQGYSLARITGPSRVSPEGVVELLVRQGTVEGVEVQFLNKEGSATNDKGEPIRGKTKPWVVTREVSLRPGQVFNRRELEEDIKRIYGTGLFSDVKVTLKPVPAEPGKVVIVLGIVEQSSGSLSGGLGYSQSQGVFGQIQLQDSNLIGRAWNLGTNISYGQFGGLGDITFTDPWIKDNKYRTSFRARVFFSREIPQLFQSENTTFTYQLRNFNGADFDVVTSRKVNPNGTETIKTNFDTVAIQRIGASVQLVRPLNGGNPYKKAPWNLILSFGGQEVTPMDFSGDKYSYGVVGATKSPIRVPSKQVICLAYNCASENQLVSFRVGTTYSTLNDPRNPTKGNFLSLGTEQFISVGENSPTFNRIRGSFTHYIPVEWLKIFKGCRPKPGETKDCKQALAFQVSAGTLVGSDIPPYEAFCLGGGNSVRGYYDCDLGVGKSFAEATIEYRFPIFSIISGEIFFDAGTTFGTQADIPGNPGGLLGKKGEGYSPGVGLIVTTPVGPLRLEVATQDFSSDWRFNLGVGWKF